ncbi:MAG: hypothetical protein ABI042_06265 [Verrucomicrobiota bacterium]
MNRLRAFALFLLLAGALSCNAVTVSENFSTDPTARGWRDFNNTNLFRWNSTNQNIDATWDSSKTNTYFYFPTGTILNRYDDFSFELDLRLNDFAGGVTAGKTNAFELTFGFQNLTNATKTNFFRGTGRNSPNLVEFAFFPDNGYGQTVWPTVWSTNSVLNYNGDSDFTLLNLPVGVTMHISLAYTSSNKTVKTSITTNGVSIGAVNNVVLSSAFTDFRVDTFALESYSDFGTTDSILAHGSIDNITLTMPPPPVQNFLGAFTNGQWQVEFLSRTNWKYVLERTQTFQAWTETSPHTNGTGAKIFLFDTNAILPATQFYRIRADHL